MWSGPISFGDRMTAQTGPDRRTILLSGPKIWDRTAYKSVRSGPVSVSWSGPASLLPIEIPKINIPLILPRVATLRPAPRFVEVVIPASKLTKPDTQFTFILLFAGFKGLYNRINTNKYNYINILWGHHLDQ